MLRMLCCRKEDSSRQSSMTARTTLELLVACPLRYEPGDRVAALWYSFQDTERATEVDCVRRVVIWK